MAFEPVHLEWVWYRPVWKPRLSLESRRAENAAALPAGVGTKEQTEERGAFGMRSWWNIHRSSTSYSMNHGTWPKSHAPFKFGSSWCNSWFSRRADGNTDPDSKETHSTDEVTFPVVPEPHRNHETEFRGLAPKKRVISPAVWDRLTRREGTRFIFNPLGVAVSGAGGVQQF